MQGNRTIQWPLQPLTRWLCAARPCPGHGGAGRHAARWLVGFSAGSQLDKPWDELRQEFDDAGCVASQRLARRLVSIVTVRRGRGHHARRGGAGAGRFRRPLLERPAKPARTAPVPVVRRADPRGRAVHHAPPEPGRRHELCARAVRQRGGPGRDAARRLRDGTRVPRGGRAGGPGLCTRRALVAQPRPSGGGCPAGGWPVCAGVPALRGQPARRLCARGERPGAGAAVGAALQPLAGGPAAAQRGGARVLVGGARAGPRGARQAGRVPPRAGARLGPGRGSR